MKRNWNIVLIGSMLLAVVGCSGKDEEMTVAAPATQPVDARSPGAAPTFGEASGTGFSTGDAAHSSGGGSGSMGYHGTGAMGTSGAISDQHETPAPPKSTTAPVLPAP